MWNGAGTAKPGTEWVSGWLERGPEVELNVEVCAGSVKNVNCRETIGAQGSGSGTKCGSVCKKRQKREL